MAKTPTPPKGPPPKKPRLYYSARAGKNAHTPTLDLPMFKKLWYSLYEKYRDSEYLEQALGKDCPDDPEPVGTLGKNIEAHLLRKMRKTNLWPIPEYYAKYSEDDIFDMTEWLFDIVAIPSGGSHHNYGGCGYHHDTFDQPGAQREFREDMNEILHDYQTGYELSEQGEVLSLADDGMQSLVDASFPPSTDRADVIDRVRSAIQKFRYHKSPLTKRQDAVRELGDVLEWLRPQVQSVLAKKDENALFQIANEFAIRHHNQRQRSDYDPAIWCSWMFYVFLSSIHASVRLIEREKQGTVR